MNSHAQPWTDCAPPSPNSAEGAGETPEADDLHACGASVCSRLALRQRSRRRPLATVTTNPEQAGRPNRSAI